MKRQVLSFLFCALASLGILGSDTEEPTPEEQVEASLNDAEKLKAGKAGDAVEYNDGIVGLQTDFMVHFEAYSAAEEESAEQQQHLLKSIKSCEESLTALRGLTPYPGGEDMKTAAIDLFEAYLDAMRLLDKLSSLNTEEELLTWQAEFGLVEIRLNTSEPKFASVQRSFAMANNMQLLDPVEIPVPQ